MGSNTSGLRWWQPKGWWKKTRLAGRIRRRARRTSTIAAQILEDRTMLSAVPAFHFSVDAPAEGTEFTLEGIDEPIQASDIFSLDEENLIDGNPVFRMTFDGSDVGLDGANVDAFSFLADGSLLLSFARTTTVGSQTFEGEDVVRFVGTFGENTSGTFEMFLDGSELGLSGAAGNIDALDLLDDGRLVFSIEGDPTTPVGGVTVRDSDLVQIEPTSDGDYTGGDVSIFLLQSELQLGMSTEDVDALHVDRDGSVLLSTTGSFGAFGASGSREDVFRVLIGGEEESFAAVVFDGGTVVPQLRTLGLNVDGFDFAEVETASDPVVQPPLAVNVSGEVDEDGFVTLQLLGQHADPDNPVGELSYEVVDGPANGTFELDAETGTLVFTPDADFNGTDSLTYRVLLTTPDGEVLSSEVATVSLLVNAVNDAPTVTVGDTLTGQEDVPLAVTGVSVADVDAGDADLRVVLRVRNGRLNVSPDVAPDVRVRGNGTNRLVLRGTQDEINALLAGLTYTGNTDFDGRDRLVVRVSDLGNSGAGGRMVTTARQQIVVQSPREQANALRGRVNDLVDSGELRRGHGRVLNALLSFRTENRSAEVRVRVFLRYVDFLERRGALSGEAAAELTSAGENLLTGLRTSSRPAPWWRRWR